MLGRYFPHRNGRHAPANSPMRMIDRRSGTMAFTPRSHDIGLVKQDAPKFARTAKAPNTAATSALSPGPPRNPSDLPYPADAGGRRRSGMR